MDKKGQADDNLTENIIFIVVNLIFFVILLLFIFRVSTGAYFFDQYYAKQIAILVDGAKPGTIISLDVTDAYNVAKKNNIDFNNMVKAQNNSIIVQLANGRDYEFQYYNHASLDFAYSLNGDKLFLIIGVKDAQ